MIRFSEIRKTYDLGAVKIDALRDVSLTIERGELVSIMGPSGSGKTTLLNILGLLDQASGGTYMLENHDVTALPDREVARIRNDHFGFVFQSYNLFPEFNAVENVAMPLLYAGVAPRERRERAAVLLERVGLSDRMRHFPGMLSGGEQQRVAVARALANDPSLILADEPTGNLPEEMGIEILRLLVDLNSQGVTLVIVTHDERIGAVGTRRIRLTDGSIAMDEVVTERFDPRSSAAGNAS
ncbi:MAG TPA: ABC transporter ATP-binding protein [Desulfobacterales bacterium]|nr:ABC transporter ATP-binding protein [Desulfobacterales bacterium]